MSDEQQLIAYRNMALSFIQNNKNDLIGIYIRHVQSDGEGILAINLKDIETTKNIDVSFVPNDILDDDLKNIINDRKLVNDDNIVYILLVTLLEEKVIEIDIRTLTQQ
jgi:hypothetical protein